MKCYVYRVARDFGFAPNPFNGYCTLATCKPRIRNVAIPGDWVIGTGSVQYDAVGMLIFAMEVTEKVTFNQYWEDVRFQCKKPVMNGSLKRAFGDNIYFRDDTGNWIQADSHHSLNDGIPNSKNIQKDTQSNFVLISSNFTYLGKNYEPIPEEILEKIRIVRNHRTITVVNDIAQIIDWLIQYEKGFIADPNQFNNFQRYNGN